MKITLQTGFSLTFERKKTIFKKGFNKLLIFTAGDTKEPSTVPPARIST
jgi:hypothetical protein